MGEEARRGRIEQYGQAYQADYGFEHEQVSARRSFLLELVARVRPGVVVEIGCGTELLAEHVARSGTAPASWVVIEPFAEFAALAREAAERLSYLQVIEGYAEDVEEGGLARAGEPDLVICSSLLHEVEDPSALLGACRRLLQGGGGLLHVNVPNAASLHRRLARAAGLIANEHEMSSRNVALEQHRVYDAASLEVDVRAAGFEIEERGGYLLKPFTHAQMEELSFLTPELLRGLYVLGRELPELASEIYTNARAVTPR